MSKISRCALLLCCLGSALLAQSSFESSFASAPDRPWCGPEFWANRLQDWAIVDGRAVCLGGGPRLSNRTLHLLTRRLDPARGDIALSVSFGCDSAPKGARAGILIGVGGDEVDPRSSALVHHWPGPGAGFFIGVENGSLIARSMEDRGEWTTPAEAGSYDSKSLRLDLIIRKSTADEVLVQCFLRVGEDEVLEWGFPLARDTVRGGIALLANPAGKKGVKRGGARWGFSELRMEGEGVIAHPDRTFGPIACTQYTISRGVLKLSAQMLPLGPEDDREVHLELRDGEQWKRVATARIVEPAFNALFRIEGWDASRAVDYRVVHALKRRDQAPRRAVFTGRFRADPAGQKPLVVAGFTGNHMVSHAIGSPRTNWKQGVWFPHAEVSLHVRGHDPDLLFFSGDQIYEGRSPSFADRGEIERDYLYKWLLWCWAYRDLTRDRPTVTIPDDHDVYQGNLWGENGRKAKRDHFGGYVHGARFVRMVERTQTAHLPDPVDPRPLDQGITSYFSELVWGRVGFAILEDRKFKSGCARPEMPPTGTKRPDHVADPEYDVTKIDLPGLKLLGDRQLDWLERWAVDWRGHDLKAALSQTIFAGMATHHGSALKYLKADLDSNAWPQAGRNRAVHALRRAFAFHLAGDQHLATIVHHGIDDFGDANWSFCVPSVANFYPRKWAPLTPGEGTRAGAPAWSGKHRDGLGHPVIVHAATNPRPMGRQPAELHDKMAGYGIVRFDATGRRITMECWPRFAVPGKDAQYEGWPLTIAQLDNYGREAAGQLPRIVVDGVKNPVLRLFDEAGALVYALRISGTSFRPKVFDVGQGYRVEVGNASLGFQVRRGVRTTEDAADTLRFRF